MVGSMCHLGQPNHSAACITARLDFGRSVNCAASSFPQCTFVGWFDFGSLQPSGPERVSTLDARVLVEALSKMSP